jgi:signal peptidase I
MAGYLSWWRERRAWKRARAEGQHLVKEARRILKKKSYRIPDAVAGQINDAADGVERSLAGSDFEAVRKSITVLDERMDEHLSFARKSTLREYSESIGVAVAIALLLRAFVVEAFQIPSGSMIPTLEVGDHIFVSKFAYGLSIPFTNAKVLEYRQPERGDVIVFKYPKNPAIDYIKRVMALPGDTIEVRQDEVYVNGHAVPRQHVSETHHCVDVQEGTNIIDENDCELWVETINSKPHRVVQEVHRPAQDFSRYTVPDGHVFVMGDNRKNSSDSRVWGSVQNEYIKGKALIVWWSRANTDGFSLSRWFSSIRWGRFFQMVR